MKVGVVDTMFSRVDMYPFVIQAFKDVGFSPEIQRVTVPGIKDMPVECKNLLKTCDIVIALGMAGPEKVDKICTHEACQSIQRAMLDTGKHIIDVVIHMDEAKNDKELYEICKNRAYKHAINTYWLLEKPEELTKRAGTGERQGFDNAGKVKQ